MSKLLGCTEPRIYTPPARELTPDTTLGYDVCDFARDVLNIDLLPWERWLFIHALEIEGSFETEWHFRFRTIVVLIARQNGKTMMSEVLALFFLYVLCVSLIIGTSTNLDSAEDVWDGVVSIAEETDELKDEIERVTHGNGKKTLTLTNSRRYKVKPSTRKGARGQSGDLVLLDELREHQDWSAWSAISKTTNARPNAIIWCMSNAGDGTSVVLRSLRLKAHAAIGDPDGIVKELSDSYVIPDEVDISDMPAIFEWSADPGASIWDKQAWAQANPSLGYGFLTERALRSSAATDPEVEFRTECLCQWVTSTTKSPFPDGAWEAGTDNTSRIAPDSPLCYGVDVSADRMHAAIAVAGLRADGNVHVEVIAYRSGLGWLQEAFRKLATNSKNDITVAAQTKGAPVSGLVDVIGAIDGVEISPVEGKDIAGMAGRFWDAVNAGNPDEKHRGDGVRLYHIPQPVLDLAANTAVTRPLGDGAWAWDRAKSVEDVSPLIAATEAFGALTSERDAVHKSAYEDHELMFL